MTGADSVERCEEKKMRRGVLMRVIGRNRFAVKMDHFPGVAEVHCSKIVTTDREDFDKRCRNMNAIVTETAVPVSVHLGPYCLRNRAFVECVISYPCKEMPTEPVILEGPEAMEQAVVVEDLCARHKNKRDASLGGEKNAPKIPRTV